MLSFALLLAVDTMPPEIALMLDFAPLLSLAWMLSPSHSGRAHDM